VGRTRNPEFMIRRNILVTMLVCGLWHGATWLFVLWGGYHGAVMILETRRGKTGLFASLPRPARVGITFVLLLFSWVLFRAETLSGAVRFYGAMLGLSERHGASPLLDAALYSPGAILIMALCAVLSFHRLQASEWAEKITWPKAVALIVLFGLSLAEMFVQSVRPFLYENF
jgi:alginate O-acetyltransferase complex protein AlgI